MKAERHVDPDSLSVPTAHGNGTGRDSLRDQLREASDALHTAIEKLQAASPNARDYYVQSDPKAFEKAREQWNGWIYEVIGIRRCIAHIWEKVEDQP